MNLFNNMSGTTLSKTNNTDARMKIFPGLLSDVAMPFFILLAIFCLLGNGMVLLVIGSSRKLHTRPGLMMFNMALADSCWGLTVIGCIVPYHYIAPLPEPEQTKTFCQTCIFLNMMSMASSVTSLICVCTERYIKIIHPFRYDRFLHWNMVVIMMIVSWIVGFALASLILFGENDWHPNTICSVATTATRPLLIAVISYSSCVFLFMAYINMAVIRTAKHEYLRGVQRNHRQGISHRRLLLIFKGLNSTTRVFTVVCLFYVLWFPYLIITFHANILGIEKNMQFHIAQVTSYLIGFLNGCVNPIIYTWKHDLFQREFKRIFCNRRRRRGLRLNRSSGFYATLCIMTQDSSSITPRRTLRRENIT